MNPRVLFIAVIALVLAIGAVFLATRDIPAPRHVMEKVIGNDRFFK